MVLIAAAVNSSTFMQQAEHICGKMALSESIAKIPVPDDLHDMRPRSNVQGVEEHMHIRTRIEREIIYIYIYIHTKRAQS